LQQVFGGSSTLTVASTQTPNLLAGAERASVLAGATALPSDERQPETPKAKGLHRIPPDAAEEADAHSSDEPTTRTTGSKQTLTEDAADISASAEDGQTPGTDAQQSADKPDSSAESDTTPTGAGTPSGATAREQQAAKTNGRDAKAVAAQNTTVGKHRRHEHTSDAG
jgi:hypothetical protein